MYSVTEQWILRIAAVVLILSVLWVGLTLPALAVETPDDPVESSDTTTSEEEDSSSDSSETESGESSETDSGSSSRNSSSSASQTDSEEESASSSHPTSSVSSEREDDGEDDDDTTTSYTQITSWDYRDDEDISDVEWGEEFSEVSSTEEPTSSVIGIGTTVSTRQTLHDRMLRIIWLPITTGILSLLALIIVNVRAHKANQRRRAAAQRRRTPPRE